MGPLFFTDEFAKTPLKIKSLQPPPGRPRQGAGELSRLAASFCWVYISTYGGIITVIVYYIYILYIYV